MQSGQLRNRRQEKGNQSDVPGRDGDNGVKEYRNPCLLLNVGVAAKVLYCLS